jgi:hypothetical protein
LQCRRVPSCAATSHCGVAGGTRVCRRSGRLYTLVMYAPRQPSGGVAGCIGGSCLAVGSPFVIYVFCAPRLLRGVAWCTSDRSSVCTARHLWGVTGCTATTQRIENTVTAFGASPVVRGYLPYGLLAPRVVYRSAAILEYVFVPLGLLSMRRTFGSLGLLAHGAVAMCVLFEGCSDNGRCVSNARPRRAVKVN